MSKRSGSPGNTSLARTTECPSPYITVQAFAIFSGYHHLLMVSLGLLLRDPNRKNHYSNNNYKKMRQMSEQARDKNA